MFDISAGRHDMTLIRRTDAGPVCGEIPVVMLVAFGVFGDQSEPYFARILYSVQLG